MMMNIQRHRHSVFTAALFALGVFASAALGYFLIPPPHPARAQFADQGTWGGTAGGTANALVITLANVASLDDIIGVPIRFIPSAGNSGPATVAITNGLGTTTATAVKRPSSIGLVALSGQEFLTGEPTSVTYDGTEFVLSSNIDMTPIGKVVQFRGAAAPRGALIEDGSCVSQTTYAALFSVIGTTYGSCGAGLFALPDSRGSLFAALDNQGANGAANRITNAGSGCTATSVATRCGSQNYTQQRSDMVNTSVTVNSTTVSNVIVNIGSISVQSGSGVTPANSPTLSTIGSTGSFNMNGNVTQTAMPHIPPVLLGLSAIKY